MNESYLLVLEPHFEEGYITPRLRPFLGSLEDLHNACDCSVIDIKNASRYFPYMRLNEHLLIVCDDNGKLEQKEPVLPVVAHNGNIVDLFVGNVAFMMAEVINGEETGEERGLTKEEANKIIKEVEEYLNCFTKFPKLKRLS